MRTVLSRSVQRVSPAFAVLLIMLLGGCGSPEQRSQGYFEKGMALLAKNDDLNARVALTTSLKFKSDRIEAWRALAGIDERTKVLCILVSGPTADSRIRPQGYRCKATPCQDHVCQ